MRVASVLLAATMAFAALAGTEVCPDFRHPPRAHFPETWFYFLGGNIGPEGIRADVEAIAAAGIRGITFFDGACEVGAYPGVTNLVRSLSPEWKNCVGLLAEACQERGLGFKLQTCPGWSMSGGPWITVDNCMRELVLGKALVHAGERVQTVCSEKAVDKPWRDYHDVAVLAFPSVAGEWETMPVPDSVITNADGFTYCFPRPVTARTLELPRVRQMEKRWPYEPDMAYSLLADGVLVVSGNYPATSYAETMPLTVAIGERMAREWRVCYRSSHAFTPMPFKLLPMTKFQNWEMQANWVLRAMMPPPTVPLAKDGAVASSDVLDLTDRLRADGTLDWTPPDGKWTVLRFGHVNAGRQNGPAVPEATGWECDKLSPRGAEASFKGYVGMLLKGPLAGGKVQGILMDSWEKGTQTWTGCLPEEFRVRRGFDVRRLLPAVFGYVIDDEQVTANLLRAWRQTLGELIEENYYRRMAELAHEQGLSIQYEAAFGDVLPGDILRYWQYADTPMCEFWQPHDERDGGVESSNYKPVRPCVSAAHVYGKKRVAAEAFTSFQLTFDEDFNLLKRVGDYNFAKGVTHFVFHVYTHTPLTNSLPPGISFGLKIGTPFMRGQPWWPFMKEYCTYLARCETQLERGQPVVDVLWYLGDELAHKPDERAAFPAGLKYDYCNPDVFFNRLDVRDGRLMLPEGLSYAALWVPSGTYLTAKSAARLDALAAKGARIFRDTPAEALRVLPRQLSAEPGLDWYHRRDGSVDIYFVSVETNDYAGSVTFHTAGGDRSVNLDLLAGESRFVVCDAQGTHVLDPVSGEDALPPLGHPLRTWTVAPGSERAELKFDFAGGTAPVVLDLGEVHAWARVSVNGVRLRDLWCAPYRIEVTPYLKSGENTISIQVVATAYNQLRADASKPYAERKMSTVCGPGPDDPPRPSGLYGPVCIRSSR